MSEVKKSVVVKKLVVEMMDKLLETMYKLSMK